MTNDPSKAPAASGTTVVRGGLVWTGGADATVTRGDLVIIDGVVAAVEGRYDGAAEVEIDATGCLVLPGLINAHVHPGGSPLLRGIGEDKPLPQPGALYHNTVDLRLLSWERLTPEENLALVEWEAVAMLRGGATMLVSEQVGEVEPWVDVAARLGFRTDVGRIYPYPPHIADGHEVSGKTLDAVYRGLEDGVRIHTEMHGSLHGRLTVHLAPHAPNTVPEEILIESRRRAEQLGVTMHLHISQHPSENTKVRERTGLSPVGYLAKIGFLGPDVLATHLTYTDEADWAVLAQTGTTVVHCATRKAREGRTSPFVELVERGVNVCLATETYGHDLVSDLTWAAILGKLRTGRVDAPDAPTVLNAVTSAPARALRRADLGHLRPGARGDVTVVELNTPYNYPSFDPLRCLVYYSRGADVRHTLVDGRPVVLDKAVVGVDLAELRRRVGEACTKIWTAAQEQGVAL